MRKLFSSASRSLISLVLLVFSLNALYSHFSAAYHYNEVIHPAPQCTNYSYWDSLMKVILENLAVTIIAFAIVVGWFIWEIHSIREDNKKIRERDEREDYRDALLRAIAKHLGADTTELDNK